MSHGGGHGGSEEPDLTAMLDVVMQLLMYFIMCVNFVAEQVSEEVQLPTSQAARPMVKGEGEVLFMNVDLKGQVLVLGQPPMNLNDTKYWLSKRADEAREASKDGKINTALVLRADQRANYGDIFQVLQACKEKGFNSFRVRATMLGGGGGAH